VSGSGGWCSGEGSERREIWGSDGGGLRPLQAWVVGPGLPSGQCPTPFHQFVLLE
jgi:hypothetical protein